jgi:hypothetical protein
VQVFLALRLPLVQDLAANFLVQSESEWPDSDTGAAECFQVSSGSFWVGNRMQESVAGVTMFGAITIEEARLERRGWD